MNPEKSSQRHIELQEVALERMGHHSVIGDLKAKYSLGKEIPPNDVPSIGGNSIAELIKRNKDLESEVMRLPTVQETYQQNELQKISEIDSWLSLFVSDFRLKFQNLDVKSQQYKQETEKAILQVLEYLDNAGIWSFKFSTEASGGKSQGQLEFFEDDSIYYMTESGASIRIKRSAVNDGYDFGAIFQPFMEKIFFMSGRAKGGIMESVPALGFSVIDYKTKEFERRIKSHDAKGDFTSPLTVYMKEGKPYAVGGPEDIRIHEGDRVNKIF